MNSPAVKKSASNVRVPKAAELVATELRCRIIRGELREGDSLPPEASLIEEFGVSRPTMREAYRILETEHLVTVARGSRGGATVHLPEVDFVTRSAGIYLQSRKTTLEDVHNARLLIEPHSARLLAELQPKKSLKELSEIVDSLPELLDYQEDFLHAVSVFHLKLIEGSQNQTLTLIGHVMCHIWEAHLVNVAAKRFHRPGAKATIDAYINMMGLIESGDADGTEEMLRHHLVETAKFIMKSLGKNSVVELLP